MVLNEKYKIIEEECENLDKENFILKEKSNEFAINNEKLAGEIYSLNQNLTDIQIKYQVLKENNINLNQNYDILNENYKLSEEKSEKSQKKFNELIEINEKIQKNSKNLVEKIENKSINLTEYSEIIENLKYGDENFQAQKYLSCKNSNRDENLKNEFQTLKENPKQIYSKQLENYEISKVMEKSDNYCKNCEIFKRKSQKYELKYLNLEVELTKIKNDENNTSKNFEVLKDFSKQLEENYKILLEKQNLIGENCENCIILDEKCLQLQEICDDFENSSNNFEQKCKVLLSKFLVLKERCEYFEVNFKILVEKYKKLEETTHISEIIQKNDEELKSENFQNTIDLSDKNSNFEEKIVEEDDEKISKIQLDLLQYRKKTENLENIVDNMKNDYLKSQSFIQNLIKMSTKECEIYQKENENSSKRIENLKDKCNLDEQFYIKEREILEKELQISKIKLKEKSPLKDFVLEALLSKFFNF